VDLSNPNVRAARYSKITTSLVGDHGFEDLLPHFKQRHHFRHSKTWWQHHNDETRLGRIVTTSLDLTDECGRTFVFAIHAASPRII